MKGEITIENPNLKQRIICLVSNVLLFSVSILYKNNFKKFKKNSIAIILKARKLVSN